MKKETIYKTIAIIDLFLVCVVVFMLFIAFRGFYLDPTLLERSEMRSLAYSLLALGMGLLISVPGLLKYSKWAKTWRIGFGILFTFYPLLVYFETKSIDKVFSTMNILWWYEIVVIGFLLYSDRLERPMTV